MMVMQHKLVSGCVIKSLKLWTDGGPAHFKMYRQFLFLAMLADIYSIPMCWCFFQSCHGECHVMTCLLPHAWMCMSWQERVCMMVQGHGSRVQLQGQFSREWALDLLMNSLIIVSPSSTRTHHRATSLPRDSSTSSLLKHLPHIVLPCQQQWLAPCTSRPQRTARWKQVTKSPWFKPDFDPAGWFCWSTIPGRKDAVHQRRCPCPCWSCENNHLESCENKASDSSHGKWWNEPHLQVNVACAYHIYMTECVMLVRCWRHQQSWKDNLVSSAWGIWRHFTMVLL